MRSFPPVGCEVGIGAAFVVRLSLYDDVHVVFGFSSPQPLIHPSIRPSVHPSSHAIHPSIRPFPEPLRQSLPTPLQAWQRPTEGDGAVPHSAILFTTSTKDDRVHPAHARKMVHRLLGDPASATNCFYYENIEGGHSGAADNKQRAFMKTLEYMFLWDHLAGGHPNKALL